MAATSAAVPAVAAAEFRSSQPNDGIWAGKEPGLSSQPKPQKKPALSGGDVDTPRRVREKIVWVRDRSIPDRDPRARISQV